MVNYAKIASSYKDNNFNVHDRYKDLSLDELKQKSRPVYPIAVCGLNLAGDLNIGTMIRSASLFGLEKFIVFGRRKYDGRSTVGADNYINVETVEGLTPDGLHIDEDKFVEYMKSNSYIPVFIEQKGLMLGSVSWYKELGRLFANAVIEEKKLYKMCFVFGNESFGIPKTLMDRFSNKLIVEIPQMGVLRSFNVAASMNIVIWDYIKETISNSTF